MKDKLEFYSNWTSPVFNFLKSMANFLTDLLRFLPRTLVGALAYTDGLLCLLVFLP
jgi:hypothetical protein